MPSVRALAHRKLAIIAARRSGLRSTFPVCTEKGQQRSVIKTKAGWVYTEVYVPFYVTEARLAITSSKTDQEEKP